MAFPLVLLAPFPFDSRVFAGLRAEIPGIHTPDLYAAGGPSLDVLADQVITALDAAGLDRAIVGGVSMGGYVVLNLLRRYPERLAGLILIDTKAGADSPEATANRHAVADRADRGIRPDPAELLQGMVSAHTFADRPAVVETLTRIIDAQPTAEIAWKQRAMAGRPDSADVLSSTDLPVLIIVGSDDAITPPSGARAMAAGAQQSTVVEIPHTGHLAVAEDPVAVAAAIASWLGTRDD
jgi:pimeloyl-ACP methyl ester carboxylesterase